MATSYTSNLKMGTPANNDPGWDVILDRDRAILDALAPVGWLAVTTAEVPSASLNIQVAPGSIRASTGAVVAYAGATVAAPASATTLYWLYDTGTIGSGSAWPTVPYVPLATVVAGASTITSVTDARIAFAAVGAGARVNVATATTTYAIPSSAGLVKFDATAGAFTATLPSASVNPGMVVRVDKVDSSGNAITIATTSSQTINGASTLSLTTQWLIKTLVSDGSNWVVT